METLDSLQEAIEVLRKQLHELVARKQGNLADPAVTKLSEELDELIVKHDHMKAVMKRCK